MANFHIGDIFKITGRGIVLAGKIEGNIKTGDFIELIIDGESKIRKISGIEMPGRNGMNGILISTESEEEMNKIREWQHKNVVAKIIPS